MANLHHPDVAEAAGAFDEKCHRHILNGIEVHAGSTRHGIVAWFQYAPDFSSGG